MFSGTVELKYLVVCSISSSLSARIMSGLCLQPRPRAQSSRYFCSLWISAVILVGVRGQKLGRFRGQEELGEAGCGDLEADFRDITGSVRAEEIDEIVLMKPEFKSMLLGQAPFPVATTNFPIGDVTFGDGNVIFGEGFYDTGIGNVVAEEAIDHFAQVFGQTCDLAIAGALCVGELKRIGNRADRQGMVLRGGWRWTVLLPQVRRLFLELDWLFIHRVAFCRGLAFRGLLRPSVSFRTPSETFRATRNAVRGTRNFLQEETKGTEIERRKIF